MAGMIFAALLFLVHRIEGAPALQTCDFHGKTFNVGDSFEDPLSCNTCFCATSGVGCTKIYCPKEPQVVREVINPRPGFCDYGGHTYTSGENFKSVDGCNHCGCSGNGLVMCTLMACMDIHSLPVLEKPQAVREVINPRPGFCDYGGHTYTSGENFKSVDGCNHCGCSGNGLVMCTLMACMDIHSLPVLEKTSVVREVINSVSCEYGGLTYNAGQMFKSMDGCNSCSCSETGFVFCTKMGCLHLPVHVPQRRFLGVHCTYNGEKLDIGEHTKATDGCNTCTCRIAKMPYMACTEIGCISGNVTQI